MSNLREMKLGKRIAPELATERVHVREKILYRNGVQKKPETRTDRINYLKSLRSKTKRKTALVVL